MDTSFTILLVFIVFVIASGKYMYKSVNAIINDYTRHIEGQFSESESLLDEARVALADAKKMKTELDQHIHRMFKEAKEEREFIEQQTSKTIARYNKLAKKFSDGHILEMTNKIQKRFAGVIYDEVEREMIVYFQKQDPKKYATTILRTFKK